MFSSPLACKDFKLFSASSAMLAIAFSVKFRISLASFVVCLFSKLLKTSGWVSLFTAALSVGQNQAEQWKMRRNLVKFRLFISSPSGIQLVTESVVSAASAHILLDA